jgi:hypothetical protein
MEAISIMTKCVQRQQQALGVNHHNCVSSRRSLVEWEAEEASTGNGSTETPPAQPIPLVCTADVSSSVKPLRSCCDFRAIGFWKCFFILVNCSIGHCKPSSLRGAGAPASYPRMSSTKPCTQHCDFGGRSSNCAAPDTNIETNRENPTKQAELRSHEEKRYLADRLTGRIGRSRRLHRFR